MTYLLIYLAVVGVNPTNSNNVHDWRTLGVFEPTGVKMSAASYRSGKDLCEEAAKKLGLREYRCVRNG